MMIDEKTEATLSIVAAIFVLFTAMLDPRISAGLAILLLVALSIYKFALSRRGTTRK
jgi:hypothetical protein